MDAIEKAIRTALEKGDAGNEAFRERVYSSAFSALERALGARESITDEAAELRRKALRAKIIEIESEFVPASAPAPTAEPRDETVTADVAPPAALDAGTEPAAPEIKLDGRLADTGSAEISADDLATVDRATRRRPFAMMFIIVLLVAAVGTGIWWTIDSGILVPADQRDGSVPNPAPELNGESFRPEKLPDDTDEEADANLPRDWIGIFETANSTDVTVPGGASAELVERDGEGYLRVTAKDGAELLFEIGEGTLERIAGGKALFSVSARAQEGETVQISVACDLAELGDCGRKRYEVGTALSEFLFEIELPNRDPGAAGTIAINPDISGAGLVLDIKEIRVAITQ